jgi:hypothetical protein
MQTMSAQLGNTESYSLSGGQSMQPKARDVEQLKKKVRKMAAGRVLSGDKADVGLEMAQMDGCRVCIAAGYGSLSQAPRTRPRDSLIWVLDGYAQVHTASGRVTDLSQGESMVLAAGMAYRLVFPQLTIYLSVEPAEKE